MGGTTGPMGHGALIYADPSSSSQSNCYEGSHFTGYKNKYSGAMSFYPAKKIIFSNMNMIDNALGFGAGMEGTAGDYFNYVVELNDNKIYGETESPDCPNNGGFCKRSDKFGVMNSYFTRGGKPLHIDMPSALPVHKIKKISLWGGNTVLNNNEFINFRNKTVSGHR